MKNKKNTKTISNLSIIVAMGKNNEIGKNNKLLWHLPNELKFFKKTTIHKLIIMGRKTFESLPGNLPKRKHVILTNNKEYKAKNVFISNSVKDALKHVKNNEEECFVIGGESIYKLFLPYVNNLYITEIKDSKDADSYFPFFNKEEYEKIYLDKNEDNGIKYIHYKYVRI